MHLSRTIISTPIGDMLALASDDGLCALEFTTVAGPSRAQERLTRSPEGLIRIALKKRFSDARTRSTSIRSRS